MSVKTDIELLKAIPKTEIHLHLEGLASQDTLWHLIQKRNIDIGIHSRSELEKRFQIHSLNDFVDLFINVIQNCIQMADDLDCLVRDAQRYLEHNNIRYAEIFYSPTKLMQNGIAYHDIVEHLTAGAKRIQTESGSTIRYITDVSRSFGAKNAMHNLKYHMKYATEAFIGIGLGGSESKHAAREFRHIFKKASESHCAVVAHAGEDTGPHSIWEAIRYLGVKRIGHGISAIQDHRLMDLLREEQIPLELCPTSNLYTATYVQNLATHPIRYFFDHGLRVTLNSDDPTPFNTSINNEYCKLLKSGLFTLRELIQIIKNGIYATFLPPAGKDALWREVTEYVTNQYAHSATASNS